MASDWSLKLKNPLGSDSEYLRLSLAPSLIDAASKNKREEDPMHLFEMSKVYLPIRGNLPEEKMMLAGVFANQSFEDTKGVIEALLESLGIEATFAQEDSRWFLPHHRLVVKSGKLELGQFGVLKKEGLIYYEFGVEDVRSVSKPLTTYIPTPKYPSQVEDISLVLKSRTLLGEIIKSMETADQQISSVRLVDTFEDTKTLRVTYQSLSKTLTDKEVEKIRKKVLDRMKKKFGARLKN